MEQHKKLKIKWGNVILILLGCACVLMRWFLRFLFAVIMLMALANDTKPYL